jgi:hypothetical protein
VDHAIDGTFRNKKEFSHFIRSEKPFRRYEVINHSISLLCSLEKLAINLLSFCAVRKARVGPTAVVWAAVERFSHRGWKTLRSEGEGS